MSFESLKASIQDYKANPSLASFKKAGLAKLAELQLPHRRIENWKYTNLRSVFENEYTSTSGKKKSLEFELDSNFYHLAFVNGILVHQCSELNDSIVIEEQFDAAKFEFETYYQDDFISILNKSSASEAHKITFKPNVTLNKPIFIHYHYDEANTVNNYNCFIESEISSEINLLEEVTSSDKSLINHKTVVKLARNAKFAHSVLQNISTNSTIFYQISAQAEKDSHYSNNIINLGARISRTNFYGELIGENAELDANGLYLLNDDQHHDTMSYIKHISPKSYSNQLYKGVLDDSSRGVFSGIIRIERDAQEVNSTQMNKNLLLSTKAHANSRPQLEIYADDVKCAHGSTTGQLNQDELFYFESRGIDPEKARSILSQAFVFDVVLKIENLIVRSKVQDVILGMKKVVQ